ncbi:hypothetical protein SAE02_62980 [Skermanella aerolata]|uniref:Uncharacterized protein n=1 Tax=Skermanella aerolata TaxID=393310 RepID=A0A512E122_9PROT|nr:hypothetical protein [Skermanella aerolata]KJB91353.1 hypothetical protein N826_30805 [Skermanella aerolata KACC 11604]GEO42150.1 hypothetical protein SAE02_62980 [Skermanella aerolata]
MAVSRHTRGLIGVGIVMVGMVAVGELIGWEPKPREPEQPRLRTENIQGAGVLKNGYLMCVSEKALSESYAIVKAKQIDMLASIGCYRTSDQITGVVTDSGFAVTEVRIKLKGNETALVYVPSEAIGRRQVVR